MTGVDGVDCGWHSAPPPVPTCSTLDNFVLIVPNGKVDQIRTQRSAEAVVPQETEPSWTLLNADDFNAVMTVIAGFRSETVAPAHGPRLGESAKGIRVAN